MTLFSPVNERQLLDPPVDQRDIRAIRVEMMAIYKRLDALEKIVQSYIKGDGNDKLG